MHLRFRSHIVSAGPENAPGYFFRPGLAGSPGSPDKQTLLAGHLDPDTGRVLVVTWFAPELHPMWSEWRDPADERGVGPSLIRRPSADGPESGGAADA